MVVLINLEDGRPDSNYALNKLQSTIRRYSYSKDICLIIIHGYGSSGVGGTIREKVRNWLSFQKGNKIIKKVLYGEKFSVFDSDSREVIKKYPSLSSYLDKFNHGVTFVII